MRWGHDFTKDKTVGDWKSGVEIRNGKSTIFWKNVFKFSWARKHKNVYLSLTHGCFHLPLTILTGENIFGIPIFIHAGRKTTRCLNLGEFSPVLRFFFPSRFFSCSAICFLSRFWFSCSALFSFMLFSSLLVVFPEQEFPESNLVLLIELTSNVFILGILQQSVWHRQCSEICKLICGCVMLGLCHILLISN